MSEHVLRGGSWGNNDRDHLASSDRIDGTPWARDLICGFRCVMVVGSSSP